MFSVQETLSVVLGEGAEGRTHEFTELQAALLSHRLWTTLFDI